MSFQPTQDGLSALPLGSVPGIALDLETTGLDVEKDRVVEIGAVRLGPGGQDTFSCLVNPGLAIPEKATAIHGIGDADVAGAADFQTAMTEFAAWAGNGVIVGYSIGFDIAVLKAEHRRHNMRWQPPRHIDVRHLTQLVAPNLPEQSLEMTAEWLGITLEDRHRALGDARAAAAIAASLVPHLRKRGITTLSQAERAVRSLTRQMEEEAQVGWVTEEGEGRPGQPVPQYARIDGFAYRHRVADLMSSPPVTVSQAMPLLEAARRMTEARISSLFVTPDDVAGETGILTEKDVLRTVAEFGGAGLERPVGTLCSRPLATVPADEFIYRALTVMVKGGFRHLGVVDRDGRLIGALSGRDLLKHRTADLIALGSGIESAAGAAELGRIWSDLVVVARTLTDEDVDVRDIAAVISRELRALTRRAAEIAEAELRETEGAGPPSPYALLVLGSGGRGESLLAMDQDNAIVYAEGAAGSPTDQWFERLAQRTSDILNDVGVAYCDGGVMASNPAWRGDLARWREIVAAWTGRANPEDVLKCTIFYDFQPVIGDRELADALRREALQAAASSRSFLKFLALNAQDYHAPFGLFGRFKTENGRVDAKRKGIMPIFSAARALALQHGLDALSTPGRLQAFRHLGTKPASLIDDLLDAHRVLLDAILRQQLRDIERGLKIGNSVAPDELTGGGREQLKWAFEQVARISDLLDIPIGTG